MNVTPDSPMNEQAGALELLCSPAKILRDKGICRLKENLLNTNKEGVKQLEISIRLILTSPNTTWERKHGALMGFKEILMLSVKTPTINVETAEHLRCSDEFTKIAQDSAIEMLSDPESRVRIAAGEVMGCLCQRVGASVYVACKDIILDGVTTNLERQPLEEPSDSGHVKKHTDYVDPKSLANKLVISQRVPPVSSSGTSTAETVNVPRERLDSLSSEEIFHDTAGWKALETWMTCLKSVITGCSCQFNPHINQSLIDLIFLTLHHTNRFVRETGYYVLGSLVSCNSTDGGRLLVDASENAIYKQGIQFSRQLATGLADNWSQVRLAASVASRKFLLGLSPAERDSFYSELLPPLCLNRYYVAEGVRIYNQGTWLQVVGSEGRTLVEKHIGSIVKFYILQTEADNHAVREAACACIAELATKVDGKFVEQYVPSLLDALLVCFKDESWPVRDAACVACGDFIKCFPDGSRPMMSDLYNLFFLNLEDSIASVRQGAAIALQSVHASYGDEALEIIKPRLVKGLHAVSEQKMTSTRYFDGPGNYGVVKKLRDNDEDLHTDKQMYSCGSLAPKMHRGKRGGGCMDHQFRRDSEPWEVTDGCIRLTTELAKSSFVCKSSEPEADVKSTSQSVAKNADVVSPTTSGVQSTSGTIPTLSFARSPRIPPQPLSTCGHLIVDVMPALVEATENRDYTQHVILLETFCNSIPKIGCLISKKYFKDFVEDLLDPVFYACTTDNGLTKAAANSCLSELSCLLGPSILRARVEMRNKPREMQILAEALSTNVSNQTY